MHFPIYIMSSAEKPEEFEQAEKAGLGSRILRMTGKVARFVADVLDLDGSKANAERARKNRERIESIRKLPRASSSAQYLDEADYPDDY